MNLLSTAFATPFAILMGTGGSAQAQPVETTGAVFFVNAPPLLPAAETEKNIFCNNISKFMKEFDIGKSQIASLLQVSRPTIDSWLNGSTQKIRSDHRSRVPRVLFLFQEKIDHSLHHLTGGFLQRKLDPTVRALFEACDNKEYPLNRIGKQIESLNFKLSGIERSNNLTRALENKKPLI